MKFSRIILIVSWSILLFFLGVLLLLISKGNSIEEQIKSDSNIILELNETLVESQLNDVVNKVKAVNMVDEQSVRFIPKEESLNQMKRDKDYSMILDSINPFLDMLLFNIEKEHYSKKNIDLLESIVSSWGSNYQIIYESNFNKDLKSGLSKFKWLLVMASVLFACLTIGLIYQLLTAWIYTKKKLIEIQSLVGATDKHIMKPFMRESFIWGLISFGCAAILLILFNYLLSSDPYSSSLFGVAQVGWVLLILLIISEGVALISTYIIVNLYLKRFSTL